MSDMRRLKDATRSPFTRTLLASATDDRSMRGASGRALAGLGLGAGGVAVASSAAQAATVATSATSAAAGAVTGAAAGAGAAPALVAKGAALFIAKVVCAGALGGLVAAGAVHVARSGASRDPLAPAGSASAAHASPYAGAPPEARAPVTVASAPAPAVLDPPAALEAASVTRPAAAIVASASPIVAPASPERTVDPLPNADPLSSQLEALARIRGALAAHDADRALRLLADFDRAYPSPLLAEELRVLRIDALVDAGRQADASPLAAAFLRDYPTSAYAQHVRSKIDRP